MKTRALRVTIGAYSDEAFYVSVIEDTYERGTPLNSELLVGPIYCGRARLQGVIEWCAGYVLDLEHKRVA